MKADFADHPIIGDAHRLRAEEPRVPPGDPPSPSSRFLATDRLLVTADALAGAVYVASYCTGIDGALALGSIHLAMAAIHAVHHRQR